MFGTDGIRGYPNQDPLTAQGILQLALSLGVFLEEEKAPKKAILIGRDTRRSGDMLESSLTAGLTAMGWDVISGGILPTPAVSALVPKLGLPLGIVLSASHNPANYNGIKLFNHRGEKLEQRQEKRISQLWKESLSPSVESEKIGIVCSLEDSPQNLYKNLILEKFSTLYLEGKTIVIDCAHGAWSQLAPEILEALGARVFSIFSQPDGSNINVECGALFPQKAGQKALEVQADFAFAFDGDGDRVMVLDERGELGDGDFILNLLARFYLSQGELAHQTVVATSMSNLGLEKALEEKGIQLLRTEVGDRHVFQAMKEGGYILGGEQSGHIILTRYGPSGDGLVTALEILRALQQEKIPLSQLMATMSKYPQLIHNVPVSSKPPLETIPGLSRACDEVEKKLAGQGRLVLRYSGTEHLLRIMLEGQDDPLIQECKDDLIGAIDRGLAQLESNE